MGYFGAVPAIAEFERQLDKQGFFAAFQEAFKASSGLEWQENRDAWGFYQEVIAKALQSTTSMSAEAANRLLDFNEQSYTLSVEKFARRVKEYLNSKDSQHRLVFMVDEVGQYIGEDTDLMLNLQTVVEDLGTQCQGRAWVVVTSQEAMDEITKNRIKGNDFSKIVVDEQTFGQQISDITLHIVTSYAESYGMQDDNFCMVSTGTGYEVLVRLPDNQRLLDDLNILVKTDEYLRLKNSSNLTPSIQSILRARGDENTKRREDVKIIVEDLIARADVFACGSKVEIRKRDSRNVLLEGLTYLVDNVYKKLGYVASGFETEDQVSNALTRDSQEQDITGQPANNAAHSEMQTWLQEEARAHRQVTIRGLITKFGGRPYG